MTHLPPLDITEPLQARETLLPRDLFVEPLSGGGTPELSADLNGAGPRYTTLPMPGGGVGTGTTPQIVPSDNDLYGLQWHFAYMGDIQTIWDEYSGSGVHVGIYDDGLQTNHPDLAANYDPSLEVSVLNPVNGLQERVDPLQSTIDFFSPHGTAVAGLIGAANNDTGTVGVAWGAGLTGVNIFSDSADINQNYAGFLEAVSQSANFDVINHSWGKFPGFWQDGLSNAQDSRLLDLWFDALENGRGGLGTIQVKAAGNNDQNGNGDLASSTRATIVVGAYDDDGDASYYSTYGANLLVSAPSSGLVDFFLGPINRGQVTTDLTEVYDASVDGGSGLLPLGYNGLPDDDYTNGFGGTSGATPIVTGVVALMLDANENLGWRDVQNILAYSAREIGSGVGGARLPDENNVWKYNGAENWNGGGLHYSEDYGFGSVDAYNAVRMAEVWHLFAGPKASANESSFTQSTTDAVALLDGRQTDIHFTFGGPEFTVDFVDVVLDISHTKLDDLEISLISPDGTITSLIDFRFELFFTPDLEQATLTMGANAFRGENGIGDWTIRILDRWLEDEGTLNGASITLHGTDAANSQSDLTNDVYHYTNEVFASNLREPDRRVLTDTDGGNDTLNLAAMSGDLLVRLSEGRTSTADGVAFLTIASGTEIENVVTGDGADTVFGNVLGNTIHGMRGNDVIDGGEGNDTLSGGAGNDTLTGGAGSDNFLFDRRLDASSNIDTITDFTHAESFFGWFDSIWLDSAVFSGLELGTLSSAAFELGSAATDALDRIIYDSLTGALYFDADGNGNGAAIQFAVLEGSPDDLKFDDFVVVDTSNTTVTTAVDRDQDNATTTSTSTDHDRLLGDGVTPILGTQYGDQIIAKSADEDIFGLEGDDQIAGGGGNDFIDGGSGQDQLFGEDGDDELHGGGSSTVLGDTIYGGAGNDTIYGSDQPNHVAYAFIPNGDNLVGDEGDDVVYGLNGDDFLAGGEGNDSLYGGNGDDDIRGGEGDDLIYAGLDFNAVIGDDGIDTVVFEGKFSDYVILGLDTDLGQQTVGAMPNSDFAVHLQRISGLTAGQQESTAIDTTSVELLQFSDRTIDLTVTPLIVTAGGADTSDKPDVTLVTNGFEAVALVDNANNVSISDTGGESGSVDTLDYVSLRYVSGTAVINADHLGILKLENLLSDPVAAANSIPGFTGDVVINAAAGPRELLIFLNSVQLDAGETVSDDTATSIVFDQGFDTDWLNGAGTNDYNLSFASATDIRFYQTMELAIKWNIPEVTTIDLRTLNVNGVLVDGQTNLSTTRIDTPLDDSVLATAGGSSEFRYYGAAERDFIRLGNLGDVNAGNDGTLGADSTTNQGLGLRGEITLEFGDDEVRILGSGAFQGGTIDGGTNEDQAFFPDADVIRMTFGVAEAIGDISGSISNFERLRLDITSETHVADVTNFDSVSSVIVAGTSGEAGENTVQLLDNAAVEILAENDGTHFGTVNLVGSSTGLDLRFAAPWVQTSAPAGIYAASVPAEAATGTIHVADAAIVNITTDSRQDYVLQGDSFSGLPPLLLPAVDSFAQVLQLDSATKVTVSGDTGWDFTSAGTQIASVTEIDASGVTGLGAIGAVIAAAQTSLAVTFKGGSGDDVFTGGLGVDTLSGGDGNDTFEIGAWSAGDSIDGGAGAGDAVRSATQSLNLGDYANVESAILTGSLNLSLTGDAGNNLLTGNAGNNAIDGGDGGDTAVFTGARADYDIQTVGGVTTVTDLRTAGPTDGTDTLTNIEYYQFSDGRLSVNPTPPTDIQLSGSVVDEFDRDGRVVGTLTATDAPGDTATFSLINSAGGRFALVGNEIRVTEGFRLDFEQFSTHNITVRVTDLDGLTLDKTFTITVTDINPEQVVAGDSDDTLIGGVFSDYLNGRGGNDILIGGKGDDTLVGYFGDDTAVFSGNFEDYIITFERDFENYITVYDTRSDDLGQGADGTDFVYHGVTPFIGGPRSISIEHFQFADRIVSTAELIAPTDITLSSPEVSEQIASGAEVATLTTKDLSDLLPGVVTETFTYALIDNPDGLFAISGDKLVLAAGATLDFETAASHDIQLSVTDSDGHTFEKTVTVGVTDANEAASVSLTSRRASIVETASTASRVKVADIVLADQDTEEAFRQNTLKLVGRDAALFEIVGSALFLKAGAQLDYAKRKSLDVAVAVDDDGLAGSPDAVSQTYKLAVTDAAGLKMVHGTSGNNTLAGTSDNDFIDGHGGKDTFKGGQGSDTYIVDSTNDTVLELANQGNADTVRSSVSYTLSANVENLVLTGSAATTGTGNTLANVMTGNAANNRLYGGGGNDVLKGLAGNDKLFGEAGNDRLFGDAGSDYLYGGAGSDRLSGGAGRDVLFGGAGSDTFIFGAGDVVVGPGRDVVWDFSSSDTIDLSAIDARSASARSDAFTFIGNAAFHGKAGELNFEQFNFAGTAKDVTIVSGDMNGDGRADVQIELRGLHTLTASDFIL